MNDTEALAALERLHKEQPNAQPWTPVLPYDIATRRQVEGRQPQLILETFQPGRTLDYGCGNGYLVAFLAELGLDVRGYDPNPGEVPPYIRHLVSTTAPNPALGTFNLVICREVLEHVPLRGIRPLVQTLCALSSRYVYLTTRFAKNPTHLLSVDTADDLDPTHITMANKDFLRLLFVMEGFTRRADLETAMDWQNKGRVLVYERA